MSRPASPASEVLVHAATFLGTAYADPMDLPGARRARKAVITAVGGSVVAVGIVLMPLPGPGTLIVAGGLSILAREYPAAARALGRVKRLGRRLPGVTAIGTDGKNPD